RREVSHHCRDIWFQMMMNRRFLTDANELCRGLGNSRRVSAPEGLHPWRWRKRRWHAPSKCRNGSTPSRSAARLILEIDVGERLAVANYYKNHNVMRPSTATR